MGGVAVLEGGDDGGVGLDGVSDACSLSRCQLRELVGIVLVGFVTVRCGSDKGNQASDDNNHVLHCRRKVVCKNKCKIAQSFFLGFEL